eukprot:228663-Rhodomonas_salina.1
MASVRTGHRIGRSKGCPERERGWRESGGANARAKIAAKKAMMNAIDIPPAAAHQKLCQSRFSESNCAGWYLVLVSKKNKTVRNQENSQQPRKVAICRSFSA